LSTLGQLDARPAEQPNPYNLYAKYGGKLSKFGGGGGKEDPKKKQQEPPKREPIIVNDKNDPRLRAYSDSLKYYNESEAEYKAISNTGKTFDSRGFPFKDVNKQSKIMSPQAAVDYTTNKLIEGRGQYNSPEMQAEDRKKMEELLTDKYNKNKFSTGQKGIKNAPIKYAIFDYAEKSTGTYNKGLYKKPVQPVVYQEEKKLEKPIAIPRGKRDFGTGSRPNPAQAPDFQVAQYDNTKPTKYSFTYPTGKYNEQKSVYFPDAGTWKEFISNQKLINSDEGKGYGSATGYMQEGGEIPNPGFGQMSEALEDALSNSKKLKFRRSGKFKALIPMEDFNDDVLNYIDKFKNVRRQGSRYIKVRGKLSPLDLQPPPPPEEEKFLTLLKGGKFRGRK
jgi:hypothetical protein